MNGVENHGSGMETRMMPAIAPDLVDMDKAVRMSQTASFNTLWMYFLFVIALSFAVVAVRSSSTVNQPFQPMLFRCATIPGKSTPPAPISKKMRSLEPVFTVSSSIGAPV